MTAAHDVPLLAEDRCTLTMVRRLAAMLDRDPASFREGDPLPFGWHAILFNAPTLQSALREDGAGDLAVPLPDLGLPRLMLGGRRVTRHAPVPIGARVRRESRRGEVQHKAGRSGRFALVPVEHRLFVEDGVDPAVVEVQEYVMREAAPAAPAGQGASAPRSADGVQDAASGTVRAAAPVDGTAPADEPPADATRTLVPDERLLFRWSSLTDNPHRIHYDLPWATQVEGYPALVVNGTIPAMFLLELYRATTGREPERIASRNLAPAFCGRALRLAMRRAGDGWRLWARDGAGTTTFDATTD